MNDFLNQIWWNNSLRMYAIVLGEMIAVWIILSLLKKIITTSLKKITSRTKSKADDSILTAAEKYIIPYLYFAINYAIIEQLIFSQRIEHVLKVAAAVITAYYFIRFINYTIQLSVLLRMQKKQEPPERTKQLSRIVFIIKVFVWIIGILLLTENLGYKLTTIITGLGVGGIAVALAAQNIIGDLFSYIVIFFDKPFEEGDMISVNNVTGTVERIGLKTSHIRSISGEQLIIPNTDLVKSTIKNIKRLQRRGVNFKLNVRYDTPESKLKSLADLIKSIVNKQQHTLLDRCHLVAFGDFSLSYDILYFIDNPDYRLYLDIQQNIYFEIMNAFAQQGIDFAFPGQTFILQHPLNADNKKTNNS